MKNMAEIRRDWKKESKQSAHADSLRTENTAMMPLT
jgi:hypothetical protein